MADSAAIRIIGSRQSSISQGHNLLAYHLGQSSWRVSGWRDGFWQGITARFLRWFPRYKGRHPAAAYNLFLANWYSRTDFVHLVWGDYIIGSLDRPERCILTLHQPCEFWSEREWEKIGRCAGIVCMAERERLKLLERYPHLPCVFIPHGVDTNFWHPLSSAPKFQICAVGRYLRNFEMLLRVARILLERHPRLNFIWLVNPDYQLPPALAALLPADRFTIMRDLSSAELHRLYTESWLFFTPYHNVTASNAIVESMACGTPVFTTRVGGMPDYGSSESIIMVENNDDAAMVGAITRCLASPELRAELGARGHEQAVKYFSWPVVVAAHEAFYRRILQARYSPAMDHFKPTVAVTVPSTKTRRV